MINSLFEMIKSAFWWMAVVIRDFLSTVFSTLIDPFLDLLPEGFASTFSDLLVYAEYANQWVPLDLGVVLFTAYWTFVVVWTGIRMVISAIPGVW